MVFLLLIFLIYCFAKYFNRENLKQSKTHMQGVKVLNATKYNTDKSGFI